MIALFLTVIRKRTIRWTRRTDRDDYHTTHIARCVECASDDERLGV